MRNLFPLILLALLPVSLPAQELDSLRAIMNKDQSPEKTENKADNSYSPITVNENEKGVNIKMGEKDLLKVVDNVDSTTITVGQKKILEVVDQPDSTRIRVGNREISIVEKDNKADIHVGKVEDPREHKFPKFRGHWTGFEWGINNFLDHDFTLSREGDAAFMDLNTDRSWCINLNFAQYSLGFGTRYIGLLTGLGLQYNNYYFDNANTLAEINDYVVPVLLDGTSLVRSKLTASFLRIPLVLEAQFPQSTRSKRLYISAGLVTAIKLGSHAKVVTRDTSGKKKNKNNDDFNINPFRYGLIARLGYGAISLYGEYYFTPVFIKDKGPELYPFSIGLALSF